MDYKDLIKRYKGYIIRAYDTAFNEIKNATWIDYYYLYDKNEIHAFI